MLNEYVNNKIDVIRSESVKRLQCLVVLNKLILLLSFNELLRRTSYRTLEEGTLNVGSDI